MSAFDRMLASRVPSAKEHPPPRTVELSPDDFASGWHGRPIAPVTFGLRIPAEDDVQAARIEASRRSEALAGDDGVAAWNDAMLACLVARSLCDPRDVRQPPPILPLPEEVIAAALPSRTIRFLYDEIERLSVEQSPLTPEATDDDLAALAGQLTERAHATLQGARRSAFRRYARHMLDQLEDAPEAT